MSIPISLTVNGKAVQASVDPRTLLVQLIREQLQLTGTHVGCDTAQCGACTIHMNGRAVKACSMLALQAQGATITTIEGLAAGGETHPMQAAFRECHVLRLPQSKTDWPPGIPDLFRSFVRTAPLQGWDTAQTR